MGKTYDLPTVEDLYEDFTVEDKVKILNLIGKENIAIFTGCYGAEEPFDDEYAYLSDSGKIYIATGIMTG